MLNWLSRRWFHLVHRNNLVYNTCWEDPRLDRVALELGPEDTVMVITSAGCNSLDYLLQEPKGVYAVDMNPRQNALLELKVAAIRNLDYEQFFQLFGFGSIAKPKEVYKQQIRSHLTDPTRKFWDSRFHRFFSGNGWRNSFYFYGSSGIFARLINLYIDRVVRVRPDIQQALNAETLEEQAEIYTRLKDVFWSRFIRFAVSRDSTLSMVGVPRAQREEVERHFEGGIGGFIQQCVEAVFVDLPLKDNYFWRVYLTGHYTPECCPEYLKPDNFQRLKDGLVDRLQIHTSSILEFLHTNEVEISRYILLDHMDWLSSVYYPVLEQEWQAILDRAAPQTRILWRSGGLKTDYVDQVGVTVDGQDYQVGDCLSYKRELAEKLHAQDRVHTYGSFYIADLIRGPNVNWETAAT
ncbi:S-adenosylmethionine--diacylglycerol 3-amino-3-carboxypropyl transferase [Planctomycetales bacterium 10988]|nr:S-adenosylmethionine--diacylglycerol 3-amino-3-carboxypropyl transferase [Planctomycetales bacterium 10988]